jgi:hypothetical protein
MVIISVVVRTHTRNATVAMQQVPVCCMGHAGPFENPDLFRRRQVNPICFDLGVEVCPGLVS